jgi:hypothetical protein
LKSLLILADLRADRGDHLGPPSGLAIFGVPIAQAAMTPTPALREARTRSFSR